MDRRFFLVETRAIYATLIKFFTEGDAWTISASPSARRVLGFLIGTTAGSLLGLSFWWSRNYAAIMQPYIICFESLAEACARAARDPRLRIRLGLQGRNRNSPDPHRFERSPPMRA